MELTPKEKITRARVKLQESNPFFSYLVMTLKPVEDDVPSMGVDYEGHLGYNPEFVSDLKFAELKGVLCHEALHLALEHLLRRDDREELTWNFACDFVVNLKVKENGFALPNDVLHSREYEDMCSEEVYDKLTEEVEKENKKLNEGKGERGQGQGKGQGQGNGKGEQESEEKGKDKGSGKQKEEGEDKENEKSKGEGSDKENERKKELERKLGGKQFDEHIEPDDEDEELDDAEIEKQRKKWKRKFVEAYHYAQNRGKTPSGMKTLIDELLDEKLGWKSILQQFIQKEVPFDFSFSRPHKKSRATGVYLPDIKRESFEIVVAIDTSGSISDKRLQEFLSEIVGIYRSFQNVRMNVVVADAKVQDTYELKNGSVEQFKEMEMKGRGGTDHRPVFEWVENNVRNARVMVALTDGYSAFPSETSVQNVLWVVPETGASDDKFPFGRVLRLPSE